MKGNKMSEDKTNQEVTTTEEIQEPTTSDIVEIEWELVKDTYENRAALIQTEHYLSNMLLQHEKRKAEILEEVSRLESNLYSRASALREELNLDQELTYELKLPQKEGEKAYFLRKED